METPPIDHWSTGRPHGPPDGLQSMVSLPWSWRVGAVVLKVPPAPKYSVVGARSGERVRGGLVEVAGAQVVVVQRGRRGRHPGVLALQPGVEPLELERVDVHAGSVDVLPRPVDQLVAAGHRLAGQHRRRRGPAVVGVLQGGVVERLAVLEDVELASEQVGGDPVGDDLRQDVGRIALLPVRPVVGLVPSARARWPGGGVVARQPVDVVRLDAGQVSEQRPGRWRCPRPGWRCSARRSGPDRSRRTRSRAARP